MAATQDDADIHLERVSKRFADTVAVDDLTLSIERGTFYALLGPSGRGKTTTLRMIGGFEDPTEGQVFLGGADVTDFPPYVATSTPCFSPMRSSRTSASSATWPSAREPA